MEREEKIQRLAERLKVTPEEAAKALDAAGGDLLDAALLLERSKPAGEQAVHTHSTAAAALSVPEPVTETKKTERVSGDAAMEIITALLTGLVTHPILNGVRIEHKEKQIVVIPGGILAALLLVRFWIVPALFAVGLIVGWKFTWTGPQWNNPHLSTVWGALERKVSGWRETMKGGHRRG